jgi:hypothetical protein
MRDNHQASKRAQLKVQNTCRRDAGRNFAPPPIERKTTAGNAAITLPDRANGCAAAAERLRSSRV